MRMRISDTETLDRVAPRTLRIYLAAHGWERSGSGIGTTWSLRQGSNEFEVLPPSSERVPDFASRVSETLRVLGMVEDRSELSILRDLFRARYDVQSHKVDFDGPLGTAPLHEAGVALRAAHTALLTAATTLSLPGRPVLPGRPPAKVADLGGRALAGPVEEGSFVFSVWIPVPPRLVPEEDQVLFEIDDEPFERAATLRFYEAMRGASDAVAAVERENAGLEAFTERIGIGVTAPFCEAVASMIGSSRTGLETAFSWALDRPRPSSAGAIRFERGSQEILQEAARAIRDLVPDEEVLLIGNVVRLHRDSREGAGDVTVAGIFAGDPDERLRRVTMSLPREDYGEAIRAHDEFRLVQVVGELRRRGTRLHLINARNFDLQPAP